MTGTTDVAGRVADGWEEVLEAFSRTVDGEPGGAAAAVVVAGETVVDLWAGDATAEAVTRPWTETTRAVVFSSTKGLVALCVLHLVQAGQLDLDAPVARYWPEFARHGKGTVTVRQTLAHRAGVPVVDGVDRREQVLDWATMASALADQVPLWEPGTAYEYHALTYGWLGGEFVRRVSGRTPGAYLREVFTAPLGLRTAIGVPARDQADIAAVLAGPPEDPADPADLGVRAISINGALTFPGLGPVHAWNDPDVLAAEIPGANGVSSAHDLAVLYAAVVGDGSTPGLVSDAVLRDGMTVLSEGQDFTGGRPGDTPRWGAGIAVESPVRPMFGSGSFGHDGAGGQLAFGDLDLRAGFAFVTSRMGADGDTRANDVAAAARRVLARRHPG